MAAVLGIPIPTKHVFPSLSVLAAAIVIISSAVQVVFILFTCRTLAVDLAIQPFGKSITIFRNIIPSNVLIIVTLVIIGSI